jgi:hypothetical protein
MNLETRRLLQEVANVRRLYENRTVSHLAADFGHPDEVENDYTESRSKVTKPKKTRKQARFSPERTTSQSSSQLSSLSGDYIGQLRLIQNIDSVFLLFSIQGNSSK